MGFAARPTSFVSNTRINDASSNFSNDRVSLLFVNLRFCLYFETIIRTQKDNLVVCILAHEAYVGLLSMHINKQAQTSIESRDKIY